MASCAMQSHNHILGVMTFEPHPASQGRRSLWDRGDASPQYLDWGGQYYECPPQYFKSNVGYFSSM